MNLQQHTHKQEHVKIGRYQSWLEDGTLKLYSHQFGKSSGMSCALSPEETKSLLDLLSSHRDDINDALYSSERNKNYHQA
jgi:hypothetical protein